MIFVCAIGLGILVGYALGGRLSRLSLLRLRARGLVPVSLGIQLLIFPLFGPQPIIPFATSALHAISYGLVLVWLLLNVHLRPLIVVGAGALLNIVAVLANRGYMPASLNSLRRAGLEATAELLARGESYGNVIAMGPLTRLNGLGDWIALPPGLPFSTAISIGDIVIMLGLVWFLVRGMRTRG